MYIPPTLLVAPYVTVRRERALEMPGRVLVKEGAPVGAYTPVAQVRGQGKLMFIDVARRLGLPEKEAIKALRVRAGAPFDKGELLAEHKSFLGKDEIRAPFGGQVIQVVGTRILLQADAPAYEMVAGMPGQVTASDPDRGIVIETMGVVVQGVWGIGGYVQGELRPLRYDQVGRNYFTAELKETIAVIGSSLTAELLQAAQSVGVAAVVAGSISSTLVGKLRRARLPVMVTEGFGEQTMLPSTWRLLSDNTGREANLTARTPDPHRGRRPELIVPIKVEGDIAPVPSAGEPLAVGRRVRLLSGRKRGEMGVVTALLPEPLRFESGIRGFAARVRIDQTEDEVVVPQLNLEALENGTNVASQPLEDDGFA